MLIFYVDFGGTTGAIDIADYIADEFQIHNVYHSKSYDRSKNSAKFQVNDPEGIVIQYFLDIADNFIPAQVFNDDVLIFNGYIRNNFTATTSTHIESFSMELIDRSKDIEVKLTETIELETAGADTVYVCNTSDTDNSIIHQLLLAAGVGTEYVYGYTEDNPYGFSATEDYGFSSCDLSLLTDILVEYDYYFKTRYDGLMINELIQDLLKECGYILNFNVLGQPYFASIINRSETPTDYTFHEQEVFRGFKATREDMTYDSVVAKYYTHELLEQATVFEDTTDGNDVYKCVIPVATDEYYPEGIDDANTTTMLEFEIPDRELIVAKFTDSSMKFLPLSPFEIYEAWDVSQWHGTSVSNGVHNKSASNYNLLLFKVIADAIVKGNLHQLEYRLDGSTLQKEQEITFEYIYDSPTVATVAQGWLDNYVYGKYSYNFASRNLFDAGDYFTFTDDIFTGVEYSVKVIKQIDCYYWSKDTGLELKHYQYEGISFGTVDLVDLEETVIPSETGSGSGSRSLFTENLIESASVPPAPYQLNDIWERSGGRYICTTARTSSETPLEADWEKAETDPAYDYAEDVEEALDVVKDTASRLAGVKNRDKTDTANNGYVFFYAIDVTGTEQKTKPGIVTFEDGFITIEDSSGDPLDIDLAVADKDYFIFYDMTTKTLIKCEYNFTDLQFEDPSGDPPGTGVFIAEAVTIDDTGVSVSTLDVYQTGKTHAEMKKHYYRDTLQRIAGYGTQLSPEEFKAAVEGLGIDKAYKSLAAYTAFINELFTNNIVITEGTNGTGSISSDNFDSELETGFHISHDGSAEFNDVIVRGTVTAGSGSSISYADVTDIPNYPSDENLLVYYPFDEGTGNPYDVVTDVEATRSGATWVIRTTPPLLHGVMLMTSQRILTGRMRVSW